MDHPLNIRLFIVDDHQLVVDGINSLLVDKPGILIAGSSNKPEEVPLLLEQTPADILLTDVSMPGLSGAELTRLVKKKFPKMRVICLSMFNERQVVMQMMDAGVDAYVLKNTGKSELLEAIRQVSEGSTYFSPEITREMMKSMSADDGSRLTNREIEIIRLIEQELSNKIIASTLFISERTVETHRKNIFRKTNTQSIVGLIKYAYLHKII